MPLCRAGLSAKADESSTARLAGVLSVAVKAVTVAGLLAVTFGPPYSFTLLRVVYSQRWADTEAPFVLGCYTAYLLLLAVNGEWEQGLALLAGVWEGATCIHGINGDMCTLHTAADAHTAALHMRFIAQAVVHPMSQ